MAQANLLKKKTPKKKSTPKRPKTGLKGVPLDKGFGYCHSYFYDEIDKNDCLKLCKEYIKNSFSKDDAEAIFANPDYHFWLYNGRAAAIFWMNHDLEFEDKWASYPKRVYQDYAELIEPGKQILAERKAKDEKAAEGPKLSPQELLRRKVNATVGYEIDYMEDAWIDGKKEDIDLYVEFQKHELKGAAAPHLKDRIEFMRDEYKAAVDKTDECVVEGYAHLTRNELKRRLDVCERMLGDLDKIQAASKATRKKRTPQVRTADKQIKQLKFLRDNHEYKLVSVDPLSVPGSYRLYTFNVKNRELCEYVTTAANGFQIKGTTIQNFEPDKSRKTLLRKPDQFLPIVLKKTPNQIDKEFKKLTTKINEPSGRINDDTILLRVENK